MERHMSTGVVTIVALMAAHREAFDEAPIRFSQQDVDRIKGYLHEDQPLKGSVAAVFPPRRG